MASDNITILPQLKDGVNFVNWKFRIKLILEEKSVGEILEKEITEQDKPKDAKARSIIVQCLSDKYIEYVKKGKTAKEMIKSLEDVFERKSTFNKLHLRKQLLTLKCETKDKLQDHFLKFDTIINKIEAMGSKMEETDKVCHLLLTMPECYENIVTTIETMSVEKDITLDFVKSCLLDAEIKNENKNTTHTIDETVFNTSKQIECYKCHKKGHKASECRSRRPAYHGRGRNYNRGGQNSRHQTNVTQDETYNFVAMQEEKMKSCNNTEKIDNNIEFIVDSGATDNLVKEDMVVYMKKIEKLNNGIKIKIANGDTLQAKRKGVITMYTGGKMVNIEALIVPGILNNILSVKKLIKNNCKVIFNKYGVKIVNGRQIWQCNQRNGLYIMQGTITDEEVHVNIGNQENMWHRRLGHLNRYGLKIMKLPTTGEICESCIKGKATRLPFNQTNKPRSQSIGELIYTDIAGPITPTSKQGDKYFQTITDDFSHFTKVYLLKQKSEATDNLKNYIREINTQKAVKVKRIRCDNGGEFTSKDFKEYCRRKGISIEYTQPYSPQQNGVSERLNRTLYNKARTMMSETKLPKYLWNEAIMCAAYQLNRSPSKAINDKIPANIYLGKLELNKLRVFGAKAWSVILPRKSKLEDRAQETRMVGYAKNGYRLWNPSLDEIITSRDVKFDETQIVYDEKKEEINNDKKFYRIEETESKNDKIREHSTEENDHNEDTNDENINEEERQQEEVSTKTKRTVKKPQHLQEYELYTAYCLMIDKDPKSYDEAINKDEEWQTAIKNELEAHDKMKTWTVTELPEGKKTIDGKWIFKTKEDGSKKARLVARGFLEEDNLNNNYSPVARLTTIRLILAHALINNWKVNQLDIPTAFLNGEINTDIYMKIPKGLKQERGKVLKMNRCLYGLKASPKGWNQRFNQFAEENGLKQSCNDFCLYVGDKVWLVIFVDDILITGEENKINELIQKLEMEFQAKNFGEVRKFLGMEITREEDRIKITQKKQIQKMLKKFNLEECKGVKSPMVKGFTINGDEEEIDVPYREIMGSLMFVSTVSRPDITYATSYLSQFLDKPKKSAWTGAKRILRYLKETMDMGLVYKRNNKNIVETFSDADWGTNKIDRRSVSGSVSMYNGNTVTWFSRKQATVSLSTAEAEYIAAATSVCDLLNINGIMDDFNENCESVLYVDNKGAIDMSKSFENSKRTKHIDIKYHFIKEQVMKEKINIKYVESENNLADILTKSMTNDRFCNLRKKLCVM